MTRIQYRRLGLTFLMAALVLILYNNYQGQMAHAYSQEILEEMQDLKLDIQDLGPEDQGMSLPVIEIDGVDIIGYLDLVSLGKTLPVTADWNYDLMTKYPNRYMGESYGQPLIIMAHNYKKHFSDIHKMEEGDPIIFTDALGRQTHYQVQIKEIIDGHDIEGMIQTSYDLSLFTCSLDRLSRITIRARRI